MGIELSCSTEQSTVAIRFIVRRSAGRRQGGGDRQAVSRRTTTTQHAARRAGDMTQDERDRTL